ncbi:hypothetical protein ACK8HX_02095 [Oryzobacter sp. R7]|uniref:hypothetical protein n=1 Tax=Oryzobacter faecalis TaxID=3388656 RepID=UPI00398D0870
MKIKDLIAKVRATQAAKLTERAQHRKVIDDVRQACYGGDEQRDPTAEEAEQVRAAEKAIRDIDADLAAGDQRVKELEDEQARDEAADRLAREVSPGAPAPTSREASTRVTSEPRTYSREEDPKGVQFLKDVAGQFLRTDVGASERLARHMVEERTERGEQLERAVGTGAFTGLVVPQYLVDQFAPIARAGRPFADACRHHDLPETGMTAYIGRLTTGTSVDEQAVENTNVTEQDADDTLITVPILTNAGQQTVSRQGVERGVGVDDTLAQDLLSAYATTLDNKLLNRATIGLTNVATAISYTDATPTAPELYPKLLQAPAAVEASLLNQQLGADTISVMHSRRWYWLQSQLTSTWPMFGQPGSAAQQAGVNYGEKYGSGFRGILPSGVPVIVDNNVAINKGAGVNEDEIYFGSQSEFHLWEDPNAPMFIRAEEAKVASLSILLVVYGYYAFLANRRDHAQKINGTGLITPTF